MIWAGAIISDKAQERRYTCFSGEIFVQESFLMTTKGICLLLVGDERRDRALMTLIDRGLYDRPAGDIIVNLAESRSMRYAAVCTSLLMNRVEDLKGH